MIRILAAACAVLALGLAVCAWLLDEKGEALANARGEVAQLQADADFFERAIQARDSVDHQFQEALGNVQAEHDHLADGIRTGKYRVYVNAKCPVSNPGTAGSVDAGRTELDPADGQRVADLRAGIQRLEAKVKGLQSHIREVCK
ncbi:lysis system i-spanin subunit Rz [Pseudomonas sp. JS3066]|uniref:lysis system i-spanin subunit Rz n=1 Tax=Pseudomonas sp. JS3066 TaxID=3090665 RepID=UPI002E7BF2CD|nr:lysis system i-spanin subunit Rz [Pseudomonas sp. JS3066]WVK90905.1 lysis system i-spanin subunit Rz [Pseudomonas sp. JS3066]